MATAALAISEEQFIEKYRNLCGHIAWNFVRRSQRGISQVVLTKEDAEDLASCALIKLMHIARNHPHQMGNKFYVQRAIENGITNAWQKRLRQLGAEGDEDMLRKSKLIPFEQRYDNATKRSMRDIFDLLPGRDGLAGHTQTKFDYAAVKAILPKLPESERIVLELTVGLDGSSCYNADRIAKKLGRSKWWVARRFQGAIRNIRKELAIQ